MATAVKAVYNSGLGEYGIGSSRSQSQLMHIANSIQHPFYSNTPAGL